jgi:hypothetical protein
LLILFASSASSIGAKSSCAFNSMLYLYLANMCF